MSIRKVTRLLVAALAGILVAFGAPLASPAAAADVSPFIATICYNTSQAGPFASYAHQAASIWNSRTNNINMSNCGSDLMVYYTYGGGSYAVRYSLGRGYVVIDYYQAQQYSPLRIMSHEMGHILGLPDNYNGNCAILMSGGSAGTSCTNPYPSSGEAAQVDYYFRNYVAPAKMNTAQVFQDSWPGPTLALTH